MLNLDSAAWQLQIREGGAWTTGSLVTFKTIKIKVWLRKAFIKNTHIWQL